MTWHSVLIERKDIFVYLLNYVTVDPLIQVDPEVFMMNHTLSEPQSTFS